MKLHPVTELQENPFKTAVKVSSEK